MMRNAVAFAAFCWLVTLYIWVFPAHAEGHPAPMFPQWERVTVAEITKPVPEYRYTGSIGSVTNQYAKKSEPVGCPLYEAGQLVGYSIGCQGAK